MDNGKCRLGTVLFHILLCVSWHPRREKIEKKRNTMY